MTSQNTPSLGIVGLAGYAGSIRQALHAHLKSDTPRWRCAGSFAPDAADQGEAAAEIEAMGGRMYPTLEAMLADPGLDAVWLPVPIHLHRPLTEQALAAGKMVVVEKPVAGAVQDVDAMIRAQQAADRPVAVGYQDVYDPLTMKLKRRLRSGELGAVRRVSTYACWPRGDRYYHRNGWAGAIQRDGQWVLDSPANNALAHFINLPLFLLGGDDPAATPTRVQAELYRTRDIENFDTCGLRVQLPGNITAQWLYTHACVEQHQPVITIECDRGRVVRSLKDTRIERAGESKPEVWPHRNGERHHFMLTRLADLVEGRPNADVAYCGLEAARAHTVIINGAAEAAVVRTVAPEHIEPTPTDGGTVTYLRGVERRFIGLAEQHKLPSEAGDIPWAAPPGERNLAGYDRFTGVRDGDTKPATA